MTFVVTAHCMFLQFSYCKQSVIENVISMASYYIKNQHRTYVTLNLRKDNFINKVHGTSYAPHKKTAGNHFCTNFKCVISNPDTLFQNSQQMNSSARLR
jgi:hypothetical protein